MVFALCEAGHQIIDGGELMAVALVDKAKVAFVVVSVIDSAIEQYDPQELLKVWMRLLLFSLR